MNRLGVAMVRCVCRGRALVSGLTLLPTRAGELLQQKKNRACGAAKSREETPKEGIYSQRLYDDVAIALHKCQANYCGAKYLGNLDISA